MRNKIIIFFVFATFVLFIFPLISQAMPVPMAYLDIIVNTEGEDAVFHFNLSGKPGLDIQTSGLAGSGFASIFAPSGSYTLSQDQVAGLKIDSIFCASTNPNDLFLYQPDGVIFTPKFFETITCTFNNVKVNTKTPVLIVPGIMGTEIERGAELLWPDLDRMFIDIGDNFMDPLAFNEDLVPSNSEVSIKNVIGVAKLFGADVFNYTKGLIDEFVGQGYVEGETLFTFPYDWRYGTSGKFPLAGSGQAQTNVDLLKEKIDQILQQTGADKIDVVAHSNGGLLVKKYVIDNPSNHKIGKAVFVGVPNTGAPKAVKVLLQGDNMGIPFLNDSEIKKISENFPVSYDLLPSQKYYNAKGSFVRIIQEANIFDLSGSIPESTITDLNYEQTKSFLTDERGLNFQALANSTNFHTESFDNFDLRTAGIDLFNVVGCKEPTLSGIVEKRGFNFLQQKTVTYMRPKFSLGDGTVPLESATNLPIDQQNKFYLLKTDHSKMMSADGSRQQIVNLIAQSSLAVSSSMVAQDENLCQLNGMAFSVFSPVDVFITDQFGNKLGLVEDGSVIDEIPGADFEVWGEHKFVFIPTGGNQTYTINLEGTGNGIYTIIAEEIQNNQTIKTEVFSNLPATTELTGTINLGSSAVPTSLAVRQAPGAGEQTIFPDATLPGGNEDYFSPVTAESLSGTQGQEGFFRSDVIINFTASDNENGSGILNINYNLDNQGYQKVFSSNASLNVASEGAHQISFFATDKAGNNEPERTINFVIDKKAPEVIVEFDIASKDLKFTSSDPDVTIADQDNIITLTDKAGNITEIKLKEKNRKILMRAEIKSIKYNGVQADVNKNKMAFLWLYDRKGNLKMLSQYAVSKKDYNILAVYDGKNTTLLGRDQNGKINKKENGLRVIKITTNNGDLIWSY